MLHRDFKVFLMLLFNFLGNGKNIYQKAVFLFREITCMFILCIHKHQNYEVLSFVIWKMPS